MSRARSFAFAFALFACSGGAPERPDAVYTVRGRIVAVEGQGENARAIVAHEAIPDFADRSGTRTGMAAMKMAFGLGDAVDAKALAPGSQWRLTFEVHWRREPPLRITRVEPLPQGTQLDLPADAH